MTGGGSAGVGEAIAGAGSVENTGSIGDAG
jgi:hypothetical protein